MAIRLQPRELDIPADDPFKHDLLDRKRSIELLTSIVGSIEGPCVFAVDAAWGTGKTTFLRMWTQHLRNEHFGIVEFNAWETDFSGDPFVALSSEITEELEAPNGTVEELKRAIPDVMRAMRGPLLRIAASGVPAFGAQVAKELEPASVAEDSTSQYMAEKEALHRFKTILHDAAASMAESMGGKPLVVVIDELDRCRPSYAVALLEVAKHLFTVNHIVFVLAVDRSQLTHSIRVLYGQQFDAEGYLRRFFDVDFRLPDPQREKFVHALLEAVQVHDYFERMDSRDAEGDERLLRELFLRFFNTPDISLRTIAQAIHRFGIVVGSSSTKRWRSAWTAAVALILRTTDYALYERFRRGEASDLDVIDKVFSLPEGETRGVERSHYRAQFEATIVAAGIRHVRRSDPSGQSPLLERYRRMVAEAKAGSIPEGPDVTRAQEILQISSSDFLGYSFWDSVERIELLSRHLAGK